MSDHHAAIKLVEKPKFIIPADSGISYKSYHYDEKEKMILDSFKQKSQSKQGSQKKKENKNINDPRIPKRYRRGHVLFAHSAERKLGGGNIHIGLKAVKT